MKIAFIYDAVYPWIKGGAEKRVYEIARRLSRRGHEVHWYSIGWWLKEKQDKRMKLDGIHMHGICPPQELYVNGRRSIKEALYFGIKLISPLMKENFDVVDCQEFPYFSCFTCKLHSSIGKSKLVITWYEVWDQYWFEYLGRMGYLGMITERLTAKLPKLVLPISNKIKEDLKFIKFD
jgi:glycosyltransferase involved in cell wall biosynthesis